MKRAGGIRDSAKREESARDPRRIKCVSRSSDTLERDRTTREESDRRAETIVARRPNAKNPGLFPRPPTQPFVRYKSNLVARLSRNDRKRIAMERSLSPSL